MHKIKLFTNMWKCLPRRARELERGANQLDKRGTSPFGNSFIDEKYKRPGPPCEWFKAKGCWGSDGFRNNTNDNNKWNFQHLTSSWLSAITWSGAFVFGWYTSQLIHLKYKIYSRKYEKYPPTLLPSLHPYLNSVKNDHTPKLVFKVEKHSNSFKPTVHYIANERGGEKKGGQNSSSSSCTDPNSSNDLMGEVLNCIENKLGLAAIENGQLQNGLKLLRSAANRNYAPALYNLGICYEMGLGVAIDEEAAMELFRSAATLEHPGALYNLSIYYGQGRGGLNRDTITAARLLRLAAVQGQQEAIDALKDLDADIDEPVQDRSIDWVQMFNLKVPTNHTVVPI